MSRPTGIDVIRDRTARGNAETPDEGESAGASPTTLLLGLAAALAVSAAILYFATGSALVALAFVLAAGVLLGGVVLLDRMRGAPAADKVAAPDWSVTVAAIERAGEAIAITDRANRMVCANSLFLEHFGAGAAPPALPFAREGLEAVTLLARNAWRDGAAALDAVSGRTR